jgi:nicotinamide-nucleotide amidase
MRAALFTIGDELLIGQVLNSNVQWMSEKLTEIGLSVSHHLTVGDEKNNIRQSLDFITPKIDALIIGGGLGPTHDDITMEVLSEYFGIPLGYDEKWMAAVESFFKARNRVMSANNKKQALLLRDAIRIDNDCGTAAGQHLTLARAGKSTLQVFVVPGVPHEMKSMMDRYILPTLSQLNTVSGEKILKETLLTSGVGESMLAERCAPFVQKVKSLPHVTLAFLPSSTQVRLRLQMRAKINSSETKVDEKLFHDLVQELIQFCGADFIAFEPHSLEEVVLTHLRDRKQTLALAESCTGGLIAHKLTQLPGASAVLRGSLVVYQNELKEQELQISADFLAQNGVVSEMTATKMALAIQQKWKTDYAIATTGYLGPEGGDAFAKIGTVCLAIATPQGTQAKTFHYENNRERSKERAAQSAIDFLRRSF